MRPIGWLSIPCLVVFFLELWSVLSFGPFFFPFFCLGASVTLRGGALGVHRDGVMLVAVLWRCTWGRGPEGAMAPASLSSGFQSFTCYPQSNWAPLVLVPEWVGLSNDLSCEAGSLSCCRPNPHGCFQSKVWGFISPCWSPGLHGLFCSPTICPSLSMRECGAAGSASGQTACPVGPTLRQSRSCHGNASPLRPSYWSGWMFLFYLLGVGLPFRSIFCQFWLCEEVQCVYLHLYLGSLPRSDFWQIFIDHLLYARFGGYNGQSLIWRTHTSVCGQQGTSHHTTVK